MVQCPVAHRRSTKSTYYLSTQVNSMPDFSNKQIYLTLQKTGVRYEQELPVNKDSSTGTGDALGGQSGGSRGRWMTRHTSHVPQLDPLRRWPCPALGQGLEGLLGGEPAKEGARLFGVGIPTWPGCWPWLALSPQGVPSWWGPCTRNTSSRYRRYLGGSSLGLQCDKSVTAGLVTKGSAP